MDKTKTNADDGFVNIDLQDGLLVLEPKASFLTWVKTAAIQSHINPSLMARDLSIASLRDHVLVIQTPVLLTSLEQDDFIKKNVDVLINTVIKSWTFPTKFWPKNRSESTLKEFFTLNYIRFMVDICNSSEDDYVKSGGMSLIIIKPKKPVFEWIKQLFSEHGTTDNTLLVTEEDLLSQGSINTIAPVFFSEEECSVFIKEHYSKLFDFALTNYCSDKSLWINDRSYHTFLEWFDCFNYSPILSKGIWQNPDIATKYTI